MLPKRGMLHHHQVDPIYKKGSRPEAVLLLHGFTGTPDHLRPQANHLHELGFTVLAPLLAGHGNTREQLARTRWSDWYATAREAFTELKKENDLVFVVGLSLGGILTLKLAEEFPEDVAAMATLAAPLFLEGWVRAVVPVFARFPLRYVYPYQKKADVDIKDKSVVPNIWHIDEMPLVCIDSLIRLQKIVRKGLKKIVAPALIIHSRYDSTAPYESMNAIAGGISSKITETVTLENSYHLITMDFDRDLVSAKLGEFFMRFVAGTVEKKHRRV